MKFRSILIIYKAQKQRKNSNDFLKADEVYSVISGLSKLKTWETNGTGHLHTGAVLGPRDTVITGDWTENGL